jgi:hypothetical protein
MGQDNFKQNPGVSALNIFQRMASATFALQRVAKNLNVSTGGSTYKAVAEGDVLNAVKAVEAEYGIYSYPVNRDIVDQDVLIGKKKDGSESRSQYLRLRITYRFVNIDQPSEFVETISYGDGIDSGDKAPGKAMTYADKYALMKAYKIETGDDPDKDASEEYESRQARQPKPQAEKPKATPKADAIQVATITNTATEAQYSQILEAYTYANRVTTTLTDLNQYEAEGVMKVLELVNHPKFTPAIEKKLIDHYKAQPSDVPFYNIFSLNYTRAQAHLNQLNGVNKEQQS